MKMKRFFAKDIKQAMRMVKDELGADAVIMSNRTVDGGVEIVAAQDFDAQTLQHQINQSATANPEPKSKPVLETKKATLGKLLQKLGWEQLKGTVKKPVKALAPGIASVIADNKYIANLFDKYPLHTYYQEVEMPLAV